MLCVDPDFCPSQMFLNSFNVSTMAKSVTCLSWVDFPTVKCNWLFVLTDYGAQLKVTGVRMNVKCLDKIRIG